MCVQNLPEELLRKILSRNLYRTSLAFSGSGFAMDQEDTFARLPKQPEVDASHLAVCKQWLRVGTPLLYEAVLIDKPVHIKTLARTVQVSPEVGRAIKRLRLRKCFGRELAIVLEHTPNVHTLCVWMHIPSGASVVGLRDALFQSRVAARPTRLMLCPPTYWAHDRPNKVSHTLFLIFTVMVSVWSSVVRMLRWPLLRVLAHDISHD